MKVRKSALLMGALMVATAIPSAAGSASAQVTPIKAVVVMSYGYCTSSAVVWDQLNAHWSSFGSTPITVDYDDPGLCGFSFTLRDLEDSGADVVILSDPTGGTAHFFSDSEVTDLQTYANEGHTLIGTFMVFGVVPGYDNSALAPLFGLVQHDKWTEDATVATYALRKTKHPALARTLFRDLPDNYQSGGIDNSQLPGDRAWSRNDLAGARIVARNADQHAAISVFSRSTYQAIYIASMPEYFGGTDDQQFLYNAIIFPRKA